MRVRRARFVPCCHASAGDLEDLRIRLEPRREDGVVGEASLLGETVQVHSGLRKIALAQRQAEPLPPHRLAERRSAGAKRATVERETGASHVRASRR